MQPHPRPPLPPVAPPPPNPGTPYRTTMDGVTVTPVLSGLVQVTAVRFAPDGRVFALLKQVIFLSNPFLFLRLYLCDSPFFHFHSAPRIPM